MAIKILPDKCVGCKLCIKACPFDAIEMAEKKAVINDKCTVCGACLESCKFGAILKEEAQAKAKDLSAYKNVWVFAEQRGNKFMNVAFEILGEGRKLADQLGVKLAAVLVGGPDVGKLSQELAAYGADLVYLAADPLLEKYTTDGYSKVISEMAEEFKPEIVLFGATHIGRDLAPRIAARINTGLTADCTGLAIDPEEKILLQTRPAFGGNIMATIVCPDHRPQMATVRPGVMDKAPRKENAQAQVIPFGVTLSPEALRTRVVEFLKEAKTKVNLEEAKIIVTGGRGMGKPEGFALIEKLADALGGVVGATRATVDAGWIDQSHQVGQTGKTVKPAIYVACGVSGAVQHLVGMQNSGLIVAINKNPDASIFTVADYGIVGDLYEVIPSIIEALEKE